MPPPKPVTTAPEVDDRVIGYGDRAVAQGDRATDTPAAPDTSDSGSGSPAAATTTRTVEVVLIDPKGLVGKGVRATVMAALEKDLNAMYATDLGKKFVQAKQGAKFTVTHRATDTSKAERAAFGALQYPVYFANGHTNDALSVSDVETIMQHHGIRDAGRGAQQYDLARAEWKQKVVEGLGIQPLEGYRKLGFIKADIVHKAKGDFETLFLNVLKHELGHMFNMLEHTDAVMRKGILLADSSLQYTEKHVRFILQEISRLQSRTEAEMQAKYERENR